MMIPMRPITDVDDSCIRMRMFEPKHVDPTVETSHSSAPLRIQIENWSAAVTARLMTSRPAPETTTRVINDCRRSLPG